MGSAAIFALMHSGGLFKYVLSVCFLFLKWGACLVLAILLKSSVEGKDVYPLWGTIFPSIIQTGAPDFEQWETTRFLNSCQV